MEELNLGHRLREDQTHKELNLKMLKNSYEKLSKKNKIIFLAGLFDGEGSFGIWGKGNGRRAFQVGVEMTDRDNIARFSDFFGGNIHKCKIRKAHWTQTWRWRLSGWRAYDCIEKMIEFMSIRRQEKYNVVKRDKIGGTSRYAHLQEASRDEDADGGRTNDACKKDGSR